MVEALVQEKELGKEILGDKTSTISLSTYRIGQDDYGESNNRISTCYRPFATLFLEKPVIPSPYMGVDSFFPTWCEVFGIPAPDDW